MLHFSVVLVLLCLLRGNLCELGCRNENNKLVDWFYLYKLPEATGHQNHKESSGLQYAFITSNESQSWKTSQRNVNQSESIPGATLEPVLNGDKSILSIFYNDEPPEGQTDGTRGHTKGVVATDGSTGFWLIHSVPKYPPPPGKPYHYPDTGKIYGQSFLCISLTADQMETVGQQLIYNEPHVYSFNIPNQLADRFPKLAKATKMEVKHDPPFFSAANLKSTHGTVFHSFAKSRFFKKELYADFIAPALQVDLLVESWQHGAGNLPSDCSTSQWQVINVRKVLLPGDVQFATLKDHSKWAVSLPGDRDYICVGDINRQKHQMVRGGGSVCSQLNEITDLYRATVEDIEPCPKV